MLGPPGGWVNEYMCHPSAIFAVSMTANFSPGLSVFPGSFADHSTLSCARTHTAVSNSATNGTAMWENLFILPLNSPMSFEST
jgi:hypothetical protein